MCGWRGGGYPLVYGQFSGRLVVTQGVSESIGRRLALLLYWMRSELWDSLGTLEIRMKGRIALFYTNRIHSLAGDQ